MGLCLSAEALTARVDSLQRIMSLKGASSCLLIHGLLLPRRCKRNGGSESGIKRKTGRDTCSQVGVG